MLLLVITSIAFSACGKSSQEVQIKDATDSFAVNYFNWKLANALNFCTPESRKWIQQLASQLTQQDIDALRRLATPTDCETIAIKVQDDSMATATINVHHYLTVGGIGEKDSLLETGQFRILLVQRNLKWLVKMEGPLRNERRNRD